MGGLQDGGTYVEEAGQGLPPENLIQKTFGVFHSLRR